jgi:diguanylate cyclase (GGDEF)-like protein/PAS domain S-box-containing protein
MEQTDLQVRSELIANSYENLFFSIIATTIISAVFVFGLWSVSDRLLLGLWFAMITLLNISRYQNAQDFFKERTKFSIAQWERRFYLGLLSSSFLWALFSILFFPKDNILYQSFVSLILIGLASAAVSSLSSYKKHIYTFFVSVLIPLALMLALQGSYIYMLMAGIMLLYIVLLIAMASKFNRHLVQSIENKILFHTAQVNLKHSEKRFRKIFKQAPVGMFSFDTQFKITELNQALADILHVDIQTLKNFDLHQISSKGIKECITKALNGEDASYEGPYTSYYEKLELWLSVKTTPVYNTQNDVIGGLAIINDITEQKIGEKKIQYLAYHDELTKLPNRTLLKDRLEHLMAQIQRNEIYAALMFIDLDHFKTINDSLGHHVGDEVLKEFTKRLNTAIRKDDTLARLGGDEFILLLSELSGHKFVAINMALRVANKVHEVTKEVYKVDDHILHVSASIGVTLISKEMNDLNAILKHADLAMYQAKEEGRNRTCFYEEQMDIAIKKRLQLENDLHFALKNSEFELYYQPIVDCQSNRIVCAEVLLRYCKSDGTIIYPDDFIPIAEESGLIIPIGYWVIEKACQQLLSWKQTYQEQFSLENIAINISPKQFMQDDFIEQLVAIVSKYKIEHSFIELELTESVFIQNVDTAIMKMKKLKALGFKLSMDDFGTGYSSLSFLKDLPFDIIKIDKSFIQNILLNCDDKKLVKMILEICEQFDLNVIAEGVETPGHVEFLKQSSCSFYQGYVLSRPITSVQFEHFFTS